jgi:ribonuclease HII
MSPTFASRRLENAIRKTGVRLVAGVDEVGRGCLAGPVMAGAVVLDPDRLVSGVADSKLLVAAERERLYDEIVGCAIAWSVTRVEPPEIDRLNIHRASLQAMLEAVLALVPAPEYVLVDGFKIPGLTIPQQVVIGGDRRSSAIAAASILAKVTRDRLMATLHVEDPRYGFDQHKGYATKQHLDAVARFGYSSVHRKTFRQPTLFDTIPD